jgi:hypothetical protein
MESTAGNPLIEVAEFVKTHSGVAVVFDLDSTLFCVSPRTQAILRQLGGQSEFGGSYAEASEILRNIEVLPTDWGIRAALERTKVKGPVELFHKVRNYWRDHFFTNHFLEYDHIYPSANEYVRHLSDLGAEILYLTGRNDGSMRAGTIKALIKWGFPFFGESKLIMKPSDVQSDEGFKAGVLSELVKKYDHIWLFENEPVIIEQVRLATPQVHIVFVNSVHSGRSTPPTDLPSIGTNYAHGLPKKGN